MSLTTEVGNRNDSKTPIQAFYSGQTVFLTGGTGFMGKMLIERLLSNCPDLSNIYVLVRSKKGEDARSRLSKIFEDPLFGPLKKEFPECQRKLTAVVGDSSLPNLGISSSDREELVKKVSIVFHVAATVRFDEKLRQAYAINIAGTKSVLNLCKSMENLKAVIHVSTAYSNCIRKQIDEKLYDPPVAEEKIGELVNTLDDEKLDSMTKDLLGEFPNTYCFTKCLAENVVFRYGKGMPTGIFRPSIVVPSFKEPVEGWIDNVFGPIGALMGVGAGLLRVVNLNSELTTEMVPVDYAVNALIASAWDVANNRNEKATEPSIFNYTSTWNTKVTWDTLMSLSLEYGKRTPPVRSVWCFIYLNFANVYLYRLFTFLLHILPAFFIDCGLMLVGKKTRALKIYRKIHKYTEAISFFSLHEWTFINNNTRSLWEKLTPEDREKFFFSMYDFNWDEYIHNVVKGIRLYIFKDDESTIPLAKKRMRRFVFLNRIILCSIVALTVLGAYKFVNFMIAIGSMTGTLNFNENLQTIR